MEKGKDEGEKVHRMEVLIGPQLHMKYLPCDADFDALQLKSG